MLFLVRNVTKFQVILFDVGVLDGLGQIRDGVVYGLQFHQEAFELVQGKAAHVGSQFDQGLFMGSERKTTHVHLDGKILEIVPTLDQGA